MKSTKFIIFISSFVSIFSVFAVAFDISPAKNLNGLGKPLCTPQNTVFLDVKGNNTVFLDIKGNNKEEIHINGEVEDINYKVSPSKGIDINKTSKNIFVVTGKKEGTYLINFFSDQAAFGDIVFVTVKSKSLEPRENSGRNKTYLQ